MKLLFLELNNACLYNVSLAEKYDYLLMNLPRAMTVMVCVSLGSCEILSGVENIKMVSLFSLYKNNFIRTSRLKFGVKFFQKL